MVDWFMCAFCRNLPWATVLRVLDMFFCEGIKAIFRVALALLKHLFESSALRKRYNSCEETIHVLRNLPPEVTGEHFLTKEVSRMTMTLHVMMSRDRCFFAVDSKALSSNYLSAANKPRATTNGGRGH